MSIQLRELNRPNSSVWSVHQNISWHAASYKNDLFQESIKGFLDGGHCQTTAVLPHRDSSHSIQFVDTSYHIYCSDPYLLYSLTTTSSPRAHSYPLFKTLQILNIVMRLALRKVTRLWISKTHTGIVMLQLLVFGFQLYLQYLLLLTN